MIILSPPAVSTRARTPLGAVPFAIVDDEARHERMNLVVPVVLVTLLAAHHLFVIPSFCPSPLDAPGPFRAAARLSTISHCQATHKGSPSYTYEHRGTSVAHCNTGRSTPE
jgi:hypothetical protein